MEVGHKDIAVVANVPRAAVVSILVVMEVGHKVSCICCGAAEKRVSILVVMEVGHKESGA